MKKNKEKQDKNLAQGQGHPEKNQEENKRKEPFLLKLIRWLLILAILIVLVFFVLEALRYQKEKEEFDSIPEMSDIPATANMDVLEVPQEEWPEDKLFVEKNRAGFTSGALHLVIPRMGVDDDVMDGTDRPALKNGPGLYTVAQMPGRGNRNTSIAGHRVGVSKYGNIFMDIEELGATDMLYLRDADWIYAYVYQETLIVDPSEVSVLFLKGYPCLTLTSCHPKGKNTQRIAVHAKLAKIYPYSADFDYHMQATEEELASMEQMETEEQ